MPVCVNSPGRPDAAHALGSSDDAKLMGLVRDNVLAAYEELYDRHSRAVYSLAYGMLRDAATAEDATQEAFLAMWRNRHVYSPQRGTVRTWLLTLGRNRSIDIIRHRTRHPSQPLEAWHDQREAPERTDDEALRRAEGATVTAALRTLPDNQRGVLELAFFGGLTQREIAAKLQIPLGTVKGRVRGALHRLSGQLA